MTTTTQTTSTTTEATGRRVPPMGGLNATLLKLEVRRLLRNRRTLIFAVIMPVAFFFLFGTGQSYSNEDAGHGNVAAFIMISMALYGAMLSTTSAGAMVSVERNQGWSRQLRLTPLTSAAYITVKVIVAMLLGAVSVAVTYGAGAVGGAHADALVWVETGLAVWFGSLVFAAFGVFMGYLLPSENVMQILGPVLALFAFLGGLFVPLDQLGHVFQEVAKVTPMYGLNQLVHAPLTGDAPGWGAVVNVAVWLAIFVGGAVWRFGRDTARV
ncbi:MULTISPECIES: ABC transporter permease [unclassified Phycicoccus]|uniref:ABC transporter permease n=1 Tax=unclassified Phycicoccus TaxID=2637926 RepID=UPI000703966F|nr:MULTISPECIES: ABC transporter permease [unclassified Phycicoccus]KQU66349.1 hypothetical protein ASC58_14945 [Phycicoccus sp. Root101]KQZ87500.1 hypothetical protein ASD62_18175 [Phycicoccus sp. Root563]